MFGQQFGLPGLRLAIHHFGIADPQHPLVTFLDHLRIGRVGGDVDKLLGVRFQVKKLVRIADVQDVLVLAMADHEGAGGRTHAMVFDHDIAIGHGAVRQFQQRSTGKPLAQCVLVIGHGIQREREEVHVADRRLHGLAHGNGIARHDQGHAGGFLEHGRLAPQATCAKVVAVVGGVEHPRVVGKARILERAQDLPDVLVQEGAQPVIAGHSPLHGVLVEVVVIVEAASIVDEVGVRGPFPLVVQLGHRQVLVEIPVVMLGRRGERKVRSDERHEQHPRLVVITNGRLPQPDLRPGRDLSVIEGVLALARPRVMRHLVRTLTHRQLAAYQPHQVALALDDVHRDDFLAEAVVFVGLVEMQFADGDDLVIEVPQPVVPARHPPVVRVGVVPVAYFMDVPAHGKGRASGDAHGAGAVGA